MSMRILTDRCLKCGACEFACPRQAIEQRRSPAGTVYYAVVAERCDGCVEQEAPLCRGDCPVPDCMVPLLDPATGRTAT